MMPTGELYPGYYVPENRADMIKEILEGEDNIDVEFMKALLMNTKSETDLELAQTLEAMLRQSDFAFSTLDQQALRQLRNWDGDYNVESIGASVFHVLKHVLTEKAFEGEMNPTQLDQFMRLHWMRRSIPEIIKNPNHYVWDNTETPEVETLNDCIDEAFVMTVEALSEAHTPNPDKWQWGMVHTLEFNHPMAAGGALLKKIYNRGPYPAAGANETIMQGGFISYEKGKYDTHFGPQMRIIIDFNDPENSWSITPSGQSARRQSDHYDDQLEMYLNGEWRSQYMTFDFTSHYSKTTLSP
ncbi:MAG: penicillin acylase family protein [Flavobacteriales bacterium]|nr:penicillin acylase family protein [Flavobacteriales bacterium]